MDGVSFIVTVFDKRAYLPRVLAALAGQRGPFRREFVFVDDGSSDGSAELLAELTAGWEEPVSILRQENRGAASATNRGAAKASLAWLKLLDGDDLLLPGATANLLAAAMASGQPFAYGGLDFYDPAAPDPCEGRAAATGFSLAEDGLARFIRNCPANSSSILVSAARYRETGGCDERLVSPDQALFLRLFATGGGVRLAGPVALVPKDAPGRLSQQRGRSRYESVLALHYLVAENPGLSERHKRLAYRRALSRAWRFHRHHGGSAVFSGHFLRLVASRLPLPVDRARAIERSLAAFTPDGNSDRPAEWLPGAERARRASWSRG
ncbi:MAG TPA: glycosyltransferase family 2 protein [Stellaceae bacterium]|nr:glycosyltransferase family 2 protein [Stellaceae bacterium]